MDEIDKILYRLGYYNSDLQKKEEVKGYVEESEEFMEASGVPEDLLSSKRAYTIKSIWADRRDKGDEENIVKKDGMVVALVEQLRLKAQG